MVQVSLKPGESVQVVGVDDERTAELMEKLGYTSEDAENFADWFFSDLTHESIFVPSRGDKAGYERIKLDGDDALARLRIALAEHLCVFLGIPEDEDIAIADAEDE